MRPVILGAVLLTLAVPARAQLGFVVCAPGYPGTPEQAQPTLDAFAEQLAGPAGTAVRASLCTSPEHGRDLMARPRTALALVTLPFFLETGRGVDLTPLAQTVVADAGAGGLERWTLVARRDSLRNPRALRGHEITGRAGYAPAFVRALVPESWGEIPEDITITFTDRVLGALRRAAEGAAVAVLLDGEQTAALDALPFAERLEPVFRSDEVPNALLCVVAGRLEPARATDLRDAVLRLHETARGGEVLAEMRLERFVPVDTAALARVRRRWAAARTP